MTGCKAMDWETRLQLSAMVSHTPLWRLCSLTTTETAIKSHPIHSHSNKCFLTSAEHMQQCELYSQVNVQSFNNTVLVVKQHTSVLEIQEQTGITFVMLTPVRPSTTFGILSMTSSTSVVNLAAPTSPLPIDTIVTFLVCDSGAAISAATCKTQCH